MLREAARVLADDLGKRVVVVDTSNEIAGDGDIPHPAIGKARRMQVRTPALQHAVMIEAVENHMPEVIVIDEIGTELEAPAARTIAERGVQLIGTAHGNTLDNLMLNPTLSDLIGGIQSVTLGDEEARRRRTQKSVLERKAPPTFDVVVEIQDRERVMVHADVAETVDAMLRGDPVAPELRWRTRRASTSRRRGPAPRPASSWGATSSAASASRVSSAPAAAAGARSPAGGGTGDYRTTPWDPAGGSRTGYRPGASGGWRESRGRASEGSGRTLPGERIANHDDRDGPSGPSGPGGSRAGGSGSAAGSRAGGAGGRAGGGSGTAAGSRSGGGSRASAVEAPFVAGEIADRGPVERAAAAEAALEVARPRRPGVGAPGPMARPGLARPGGLQGRGGDRAGERCRPGRRRRAPGRPGGRRCRGGGRPGPPRRERDSCRPCASFPTGSAASAWSRRSATSSCRSSSPATSTRRTW